ncbi:hypothetical protein AB0G04_34505 [Actinoplanes sp. NPDC023801]|uniref:hypothetical protein n=1 Tax=Actinoplanes sp. NPDC023801 TaxID=3154595 RepID=UPI0033D1507D
MGTDINGYIEIRRRPSGPDGGGWTTAVDLFDLYRGRDYDSFACLFGVRNYAGFRPVAAGRGLPPDAAEQTRKSFDEFEDDALWPTWIGGDEIRRIDWSEPAEHADTRLHRYERRAGGQWTFESKAAWSREAFEVQGIPETRPGTPSEPYPDGTVWTKGDVQFRAVRMTRRDAVPAAGEWTPVWEVMAILGRLHGDENCRLVVWFDQ